MAFPTGPRTYEVHKVTATVDDVRKLLARLVRLGVVSYLMALSGSLVLLFEFLNVRAGGSEGYHAPSVVLALVLIVIPAVVSSGTSLGAQIIRPHGGSRASLQSNSTLRNASYFALTGLVAALTGSWRNDDGSRCINRQPLQHRGSAGVQSRHFGLRACPGFILACAEAILGSNRQRTGLTVPQSCFRMLVNNSSHKSSIST